MWAYPLRLFRGMRRPIIAGNWKMNKGLKGAIDLASSIVNELSDINDRDVVLCPPFTALDRVGEVLRGSNISLGAQNLFYEDEGPYTGEISASQIKDLGCKFVIIGHSERRQFLKETDLIINKKIKEALKWGLSPIFCVGETEEERKQRKEKEVVKRQITLGLEGIEDVKNIIIAYEPVWAIGTGNTCKSEDAEMMHIFIRDLIAKLYSKDLANFIRIQYGGSVKPENIDEIMRMPNIDGALVGGASLDASSFCRIVKFKPQLASSS